MRNIEENKKNVFWGFNKLMSVPNDKRSFFFQSAIAVLYEAGIAAKHIEENFHINFKTIKKWHDAFSSTKTFAELNSKLQAPGREEYKLNDEISDFIADRVNHYKKENIHNFNVRTKTDVEKKYGITICVETIRRVCDKTQTGGNEKQKENSAVIADKIKSGGTPTGEKSNGIPVLKLAGKVFRNTYAGVLLLSAWIGSFLSGLGNLNEEIRKLVVIWLFGIILGGRNLEQYRYMNHPDFEFISQMEEVPGVETLRRELKGLSVREDTKLSSSFLKSMVKTFRYTDGNDFYIDGHVSEYSGKANILEGWNTRKNRVTKGYVSYYVHNSDGNPLFSLIYDNFYDFREVIRQAIVKIKKLVKSEGYVLIYDRGGFSHELMKEIIESGGSFISWEKGFRKEEIEGVIKFKDRMTMEFSYNDMGKTTEYKIDFHEMTYRRNDFECRRIVIRRDDSETGKKLYQSILTSDREVARLLSGCGAGNRKTAQTV